MAWSFAAWNLSGGLPGQGVFRISIKKKKDFKHGMSFSPDALKIFSCSYGV